MHCIFDILAFVAFVILFLLTAPLVIICVWLIALVVGVLHVVAWVCDKLHL
jgi:hypothetical protein